MSHICGELLAEMTNAQVRAGSSIDESYILGYHASINHNQKEKPENVFKCAISYSVKWLLLQNKINPILRPPKLSAGCLALKIGRFLPNFGVNFQL